MGVEEGDEDRFAQVVLEADLVAKVVRQSERRAALRGVSALPAKADWMPWPVDAAEDWPLQPDMPAISKSRQRAG